MDERFRFIGEQLKLSEVEITADDDGLVALVLQKCSRCCRPLGARSSFEVSTFVFLLSTLRLMF